MIELQVCGCAVRRECASGRGCAQVHTCAPVHDTLKLCSDRVKHTAAAGENQCGDLSRAEVSRTSLVLHKGIAPSSQQHVNDLDVIALSGLMKGCGAEGTGCEGVQVGTMPQQLRAVSNHFSAAWR